MTDDEKTWLRPDQAAIIWDEELGFQAMLPKMDDDKPVPPEILLLMTFLMRVQTDQKFVNDLTAWMDNKAGSFEPQEGEDNETGLEQGSST